MTPKSNKKHYSAKNRHQNPLKTGADRSFAGDKISRDQNRKRTSPRSQTTISRYKTTPKPPQNGYFIWGRHAVFAALANPERRIQQIYVLTESTGELERALNIVNSQRRAEIPRAKIVDRTCLDGIGGIGEKAVHQGIAAAVWPLNSPHLDTFLEGINHSFDKKDSEPVRLLLLDQISDPRNFGAIMRSARAFDVTGVITTKRNAANENGVLARAASGALDRLPLLRVVNLSRAIEQLRKNGFFVAGLAGDGNTDVSSLRQHKHLAIILGAEGNGLRRLSRDHCDMLVRININNDADSLNVSIAAAIALYAANAK